MKRLFSIYSLGILFLLLHSGAAKAATFSVAESRLVKATNEVKDRPSFYIQCQLRYSLDCENLREAFFDRVNVIDRVDNPSAQIVVLLTDESTTTGVIVRSKWSSSEEISMVDFSLPDLFLPNEYDAAKMQSEILTLLVQGLIPHIQVKSGNGLEEVIIASLGDPTSPPTEKTGPFYASFGIAGSASKSGIGSQNSDGTSGPSRSSSSFSGTITLNHSTERTRLLVNGKAFQSKSSLPGMDGTSVSAENTSKSVDVLAVYSLTKSKRWNVALMGSQSGNAGANLKKSGSVGAGLEYTLVPFRIDQPYEFRVHTKVNQFSDRLVMVNDRGNFSESYKELSLQLYAYWLLLKDKASLSGTIDGSKNLTYSDYSSVSANATFSYQITRGVRMNTSASYGFLKKDIRFPGMPDFSNPLQTQYQSGYSGGSYYTSVGLTFIVGKGGAIFSRDRRFQ